jgi:hypothetical protein
VQQIKAKQNKNPQDRQIIGDALVPVRISFAIFITARHKSKVGKRWYHKNVRETRRT